MYISNKFVNTNIIDDISENKIETVYRNNNDVFIGNQKENCNSLPPKKIFKYDDVFNYTTNSQIEIPNQAKKIEGVEIGDLNLNFENQKNTSSNVSQCVVRCLKNLAVRYLNIFKFEKQILLKLDKIIKISFPKNVFSKYNQSFVFYFLSCIFSAYLLKIQLLYQIYILSFFIIVIYTSNSLLNFLINNFTRRNHDSITNQLYFYENQIIHNSILLLYKCKYLKIDILTCKNKSINSMEHSYKTENIAKLDERNCKISKKYPGKPQLNFCTRKIPIKKLEFSTSFLLILLFTSIAQSFEIKRKY